MLCEQQVTRSASRQQWQHHARVKRSRMNEVLSEGAVPEVCGCKACVPSACKSGSAGRSEMSSSNVPWHPSCATAMIIVVVRPSHWRCERMLAAVDGVPVISLRARMRCLSGQSQCSGRS